MLDQQRVVQSLSRIYFTFFWSCLTGLALACFPFPIGVSLAVIPIFAGASVVFASAQRIRDQVMKSLVNDQFGALLAVSQYDQSKLPLPLRWIIAVGSFFGLVMSIHVVANGQFWEIPAQWTWHNDVVTNAPEYLATFISSGISLCSFLFFIALTILLPKLLHRTRWSWTATVAVLLTACLCFLAMALSSHYQGILVLYPTRSTFGAQIRLWAATGFCLSALGVLFRYRHLYFLDDSEETEPVPDFMGWLTATKLRRSMVKSAFLLVVIYFLGTYVLNKNPSSVSGIVGIQSFSDFVITDDDKE